MRELKTDYVNAELDIAENEYTKYRKTINPDNTESFKDVSVYTVTGDDFGAEDLNATNEQINLLESIDKVTLLANGWSSTIPYTQTVNLERILEVDSPIISMGVPDNISSADYKAMNKAYGFIDRVVSGNGTLTFYCYNKRPNVAINVLVKGV